MARIKEALGGAATAGMLILFVILMVPASSRLSPKYGFLAVMLLMLMFMIVLGVHICGRLDGILINERNLVSLSRFQIIVWTLIILSAFLTAVFGRLYANHISDALAIGMDQRLWALLGISTASLVGTPLLLSNKKQQEPKPDAVKKAATSLKVSEDVISDNSQGVLFANPAVRDAAFSDMFLGDEVTNKAYIDVAKVQMFFFTVVAAISYGVTLYEWLEANKHLEQAAKFPELSAGLIAVLAISHAGFQVNNAVTRTPTT